MYIGEICTRSVVVAGAETGIVEAAQLMRQHHVGDVVVVTERDGKRFPTGVVTDRDIVVEVLALQTAPDDLTVGDLQGSELITVKESDEMLEVLEVMQRHGIRRTPVVDSHGALVGIVTLDDLLELLAEEIGFMVRLIAREQYREAQTRPAWQAETETQ